MSIAGHVEINMCKFTWKLKDFSKLCKNVGDIRISPIFQIKGVNDFRWKLLLYPFGDDEHSKDFLSLFLESVTYQESVKICFELILSDMTGRQIKSLTGLNKFTSKGKVWGWNKFIARDILLQKNDELLDDRLNIICIINMDAYSINEVQVPTTILYHLETLLLTENLSDLTITINDKQIKAHKNILAARSKVFKAMFSHNMKENNTNTIKITDVSYNNMKEILLFIYSGKVTNLNKNAKALLPVAEKYAITDLKVLCEKSIWKNVKNENVCEALNTADLYKCSELKAMIIEYIISNIKQINKTAEFKDLNRSNPQLFEEIFTEIVEKKC